MNFSFNDAYRVISKVIDERIRNITRSGAGIEFTWGTVAGYSSPYVCSVYLFGDTVASGGFRLDNGLKPNLLDPVRVAIDKRGNRWIDSVINDSSTPYPKMEIDVRGGQIRVGNGSAPATPLGGGSATAHSTLTGLTNDDHTQYLLDSEHTLAAHDALGLATQVELDAHTTLAAHDALGLATQAELDTHAATPHGGGGGVTDHGALTGLSDDDHNIYEFKSTYNVKRYGAVGNGTTNDTAAFQAAIDACYAAGGGTVLVPASSYKISTTLVMYENIIFRGNGVINTKLISGEGVGIMKVDGAAAALKKEFSIRDITFVNGSTAASTQPLLDIRYCGERSIILSNLLFDGSDYGCVGLRLYNSWGLVIDNPTFIRFSSTTLPALEFRSSGGDGVAGHPMNSIVVDSPRWQECKIGCHIGNTSEATPGPMHSITFINPRMKMGTMDVNSYGIRGMYNQIWGVNIIGGFFEDVARPIVATGFNWRIDGAFIEHATTGIALETGGSHRVDNVSFSGPTNNEIGTCVHFKSTLTEPCSLFNYTLVSGTLSTTVVIVNDAGLLAAPEVVAPSYGLGNASNSNISVAGRGLYIPVIIDRAVGLSSMNIIIGTSGGNVCVGLYDVAGSRLATSGSVASPSVGRAQIAFTSTVYVPKGTYYAYLGADNTTVTFGHVVATTRNGIGSVRYQDVSAFPAPATASFAGQSSSQPVVTVNPLGSFM